MAAAHPHAGEGAHEPSELAGPQGLLGGQTACEPRHPDAAVREVDVLVLAVTACRDTPSMVKVYPR
jgi:hypothetical protein